MLGFGQCDRKFVIDRGGIDKVPKKDICRLSVATGFVSVLPASADIQVKIGGASMLGPGTGESNFMQFPGLDIAVEGLK